MNFNESSLKLVEKKLVCDIFENLKNSENVVDKNQLLLFLLSLINLYEYYLLKINKYKFNISQICTQMENQRNELIKSKSRSQEKISLNKISKKTKAEENKDFNLLSINWSNYNHVHNKEKNKQVSGTINSNTFKPIINSNSKKLSINFRRKIQSV